MIKDYLEILNLKNLFEYRTFYSKWGKEIPFVTRKYIYMYKSLASLFAYTVLVGTSCFVLIYEKSFINYFYSIFILVFFIYLNFKQSGLELYDQKYKVISFLKNRVFDKKQIIKNINKVIIYDIINEILILLITFNSYFIIKFKINNIININEIFICLNIFFFSSYLIIKKVTNTYYDYSLNNIKKCNIKKNIINLLLISLCLYAKFNEITFKFEYDSIYFLNDKYISFINNILNSDTFFINIIFFILNLVLFYSLHFYSKKTFYINSNIQDFKLKNIIKNNNTILFDFFEKEVITKFTLMTFITLILLIIKLDLLKKTLITSFCTSFLFTQYNQRYLLNEKFLEFVKILGKKNNLLKVINKQLISIQLIIAMIFILSIQNFSIQSCLYSVVGLIFFLFNIKINTIIYNNGLNLKYSNIEKLNLIEKISGSLYIMEILILLLT